MDSVDKNFLLSWSSTRLSIHLNKNFSWITAESIDDAMAIANSIISAADRQRVDSIEIFVKNKDSGRMRRVAISKDELLDKNNWNQSHFSKRTLYFSTRAIYLAIFY